MECEPKQTLTWGSNSRCFGEIQLFHSPDLSVLIVLSAITVNMAKVSISNTNFNCDPTIVIPWHSWQFSIGQAVSSTIDLVNSDTLDSVNLLYFVMCAFASKPFPIELVQCSDGWQRTWWHTIHMMPGLPVFSIPQCKLNHHTEACLESFQAIERFKSRLIEVHEASNMIWRVKSFTSRIKTRSFWKIAYRPATKNL